MDDAIEATSPLAEPTVALRPSGKARRNYRSKRRDSDNEDEDQQQQQQGEGMKEQGEQHSKDTNIDDASSSTASSTLPYIQSQNAQNLGEVYPGLARLSFLDQEQGSGETGEDVDGSSGTPLSIKKSRRPLQQKPQPHRAENEVEGSSAEKSGQEEEGKSTVPEASAVVELPPATSPSALSSGTGSNMVEIGDTGLAGKGRGLYSAAKEVLKSGTLVFKELGYCQVVNDASLSQVCSACFKDVREELGEGEPAASSGAVPAGGQRKLVRCAGCKVVWYCNKTCQIKDWKLHHQLECQGIQKSMTNSVMKEVWTKRTMETTSARALCRMIRRRERVKTSVTYKAEHGKLDAAQKQVNEVYFSGLDQKEDEWLDEHGSTWIERYLNTYEQERESAAIAADSSKGTLEESSQFAKTMAVVISCVVTPKEDRHTFLKGVGEVDFDSEVSTGAGGFDLLRKMDSYGFAITNLETTAAIGLALYVQCMPYVNHSCVPNCVYTFRGSRVECRVIRDIQPGEEMTISYIDQIGTTQERQAQLKAQYHFTCDCPLCKYYPANPLIKTDGQTLKHVVSGQLPEPLLDPKQGFVCPKEACKTSDGRHSVLVIESQLEIYNKVELKCKECGHIADLTQELVQENEEDVKRLITGFVREMNGGAAKSKSNSRNFELAKLKVSPASEQSASDGAAKPAVVGGMATVQEPSSRALQLFDDAYTALTGVLPPTTKDATAANTFATIEEDPVCRSELHRLVRQLEQTGFDEAVSRKNWIFALHRSVELGRILNETYVGHHPLKAIQGYYTCKIANLLANLLLEESTVEIEDSDHESEDEDQGMPDSDDERDLKALRNAMGKGSQAGAAAVSETGSGSMQEQLLRRKRKEKEGGATEETRHKKKAQEMKGNKRTQAESSRELLQYLKSLIVEIEDPRILHEFRVCWGKDGKLGSRYRYQVDSLKQALHYAGLPLTK
ncbi:hypothetical protein EDD21DRAFT_353425 [Dissophora ornata]|nr:hypothetical protein BGZ58_008722 [Dissophora ornata]KAI8601709.1 hypothetical protein EDD21DRAFT_353425 [Dissophora ornata]